MSWLRTPRKGFFVRSAEQNICPSCNGKLKVRGSRRRKYINSAGETIVLVIRRLGCLTCQRIHHELPDILVPYKRYARKCIEAVVTKSPEISVTADESTLGRWRSWFQDLAEHFLGCLTSIAIRYGRKTAEDRSGLPSSKLQRIWRYVGDAPGWLGRVVRPVVNANLWRHTRFAFLS